jgi:cbb3-type cytochrome oxidase subunit 1
MPDIHLRFLRISVLYLIAGMALGLAMGISGNHQYFPTHAHINLVGWVSFALYGLIYRQFPAAASAPLARWHFWVSNVGALLLAIGIAGINAGYSPLIPVAGTGAIITLLSAVILAVILYRHAAGTSVKPNAPSRDPSAV